MMLIITCYPEVYPSFVSEKGKSHTDFKTGSRPIRLKRWMSFLMLCRKRFQYKLTLKVGVVDG